MAEWVPIQAGGFVVADVIRWKEGVYKARRSRKTKAPRLGDRIVTAEVLKEPDANGWTQLLVRGCEVVAAKIGRTPWEVPLLPKDTEIKRARKTIMRGKPERMLWSDESARAVVASKFLSNSQREPS
jgi:hypothetical protein